MKLNKLQIGYKSSAPIVEAIDAELCLGSFVCLIGQNGTGKSTLLKTIAGLQPPLDGTIEISSSPSTSISNSKQQASNVAIVLTKTPELQNTTALEMVSYGRLSYSNAFGKMSTEDKMATEMAIRTMHIEHLAQQNFATLSDGQRQKVMIARALAQGSDYLLLDEPSAFLDYPSKIDLLTTLKNLAHSQNKGILLSTHDLELAARFADVLWELNAQPLQLQLQEPQPPRLFFRTITCTV